MSNPILHCLLILASGLLPLQTIPAQNILLFEDFESGNFAAKGWYDGFPDQRTDTEFKNGRYSYAGRFVKGARTSGAGRHLFKPTDRVYISYWVKYSANYIGSGVGYHPHEWNILTDRDGIYQGPADTYLSAYIEQNAGKPILALQDSKNVDPNCILLNNNNVVGCNGNFKTYPFTENRSVCSCNGLIGQLDRRDCYPNAGSSKGYYSSRAWHADTVYFRNNPGPFYKNDWHFVEAYFELNTIAQGKGVANGKIRYWYDGQLLIASDSILMRTAAHPDMKFNQLLYGPYIGVGSPVDQSWWIDDLTIADGRPVTATTTIKKQDPSFTLYPNPNDGTFTVQFNEPISNPQDLQFEILDALGRVLRSESVHSHTTSLSHHLPAGIYLCRLNGKEGISRPTKLVIR